MLPDFVTIKKELHRRLVRELEARMLHHAPLLSEIGRHRQVEGNQWGIERDDGRMEIRDFKEVSSKMVIAVPQLTSNIPQGKIAKLDEVASDLAKQSMGMLFTTVKEVTDETGNVLDAGGQSFHPSMMWEALEKMHVDFDERGNPILPTIVCHPDVFESIRIKLPEWDTDQQLQAQREEVLRRKKEEWLDRESNRKLVG